MCKDEIFGKLSKVEPILIDYKATNVKTKFEKSKTNETTSSYLATKKNAKLKLSKHQF
jgi:hypothetical protein